VAKSKLISACTGLLLDPALILAALITTMNILILAGTNNHHEHFHHEHFTDELQVRMDFPAYEITAVCISHLVSIYAYIIIL
jgi:hypothetical protein